MERLRLQISELSWKIDNEPEKNVLSNVIKNPEGSSLLMMIKDIEVKPENEDL